MGNTKSLELRVCTASVSLTSLRLATAPMSLLTEARPYLLRMSFWVGNLRMACLSLILLVMVTVFVLVGVLLLLLGEML